MPSHLISYYGDAASVRDWQGYTLDLQACEPSAPWTGWKTIATVDLPAPTEIAAGTEYNLGRDRPPCPSGSFPLASTPKKG